MLSSNADAVDSEPLDVKAAADERSHVKIYAFANEWFCAKTQAVSEGVEIPLSY